MMDANTAASASAPKVSAPASKPHQLAAATVYKLVKVSHTRRVEVNKVVRRVYNTHLKDIDVAFEQIPEEPMRKAVDDLKKELPDIFEQCNGDWFGAWALHNRHRGRFRAGKKRNDLEGTPTSGDDEELGRKKDDLEGTPALGDDEEQGGE